VSPLSVTFTNKCSQYDYRVYVIFKKKLQPVPMQRCHLQGVTNTKEFKHQQINIEHLKCMSPAFFDISFIILKEKSL
jgi:hypothetical protein